MLADHRCQLCVQQAHDENARVLPVRHARDGAEDRVLQCFRHGEESLALLGFGRDDVAPRDCRSRLRDQRLAFEHRAGIDRVGLAEPLQQGRNRLRATLGQQADEGRPLGEDARGRQRVFPHASQVFAGDRAGELHARLALLVSEVAQHSDGEPGDAGDDEHDRAEVDGGQGPRQARLARVEAEPRNELAEALQHRLL